MRIMNFYDDIDSLVTQNTYEVDEVNARFNAILGSWWFITLCTIIYDFFVV